MLGRFVGLPQPVALWQALTPPEIALLVNEWLLFEKYMVVLHQVGETKVVRAKKRILQDGLGEIALEPHSVKVLMPLKLSRVSLDAVAAALPAWSDPQTSDVLALLKLPYGRFYDFKAAWSVAELEALCREAGVALPAQEDT